MLLLVLATAFAAGSLEQVGVLSPAEKMAFAADAIDEMRSSEQAVQALLREAGGPSRSCLQRQEQRLRELIDASETASARIPEALAAGLDGRAEMEFRKVTIALGSSRQERLRTLECAALPTEEPQAEKRREPSWEGRQL